MNINKAGSEFPVILFTTIIYDNNNNPLALAGISSDITERKKIEKELLDHRDHLERLIDERTQKLNNVLEEIQDLYDNAPCGYHSLDEKGVFIRINNTELKWLGYEREEVINKIGTEDVLTPESRKLYIKVFNELKKHGEIKNVEYEYVRKDGTTFLAHLMQPRFLTRMENS